MSLPLTRRIARAALLIAAGAAPVVGAAGSASAVDLQQATPLGGLSSVDAESLGGTLDSTAAQATELAGSTGGNTVAQAVPTAGKSVGKVGGTAAPALQKTAGEVSDGATGILGGGAGNVTGALPADTLPLKGLPLG
ncbi:ATP-binding protein [Streptomyces jumonjinensis]|uniref:ATP-binding protein n=1 Tax=Streptomyces jumonjinensis TaxID=1945 RepID=UPI0037B30230